MHSNIQAFYEKAYAAEDEIPRRSKLYTIGCVPEGGGLTVLDVGCGSGMNAAAIAAKGHRVVGIDISETAIQKFRARGFEGKICDIESGFDFPDAQFDVVFCSEVIEHMTSPELLVAEMSRVVKPSGLLVLSTPNSAFWLYRLFSVFGYTLSEVQHPKHFQFAPECAQTSWQLSVSAKISDRPQYVSLAARYAEAVLADTYHTRFRTAGSLPHEEILLALVS